MLDLDNDSFAMQYNFINNNSNPLGSKAQLDHAQDRSSYSSIHQDFHPDARTFLEKFGYHDIFLVDIKSGDIVYSVYKEIDFSTSLLDGPYANTGAGQVFRDATTLNQGEVAFSDFAICRPSYDTPASFIASPIFEKGIRTGILMFQLPLNRITQAMRERAGLGNTGETYLVGEDHLMRSDSFLNPELGSVLTKTVDLALSGETGIKVVTNFNEALVL